MMLFIFLIILFIMPLKIEFKNDGDERFIYLYITLLFNLKIRIKKYQKRKKSKMDSYIMFRKLFYKNKAVRFILRTCEIKKAYIVMNSKSIYSYVFNNNLIILFDNLINESFKKVNNTYYKVSYDSDESTKILFLISFKFINILFVIINSFNEFMKLIRILKKGGYNGTSN